MANHINSASRVLEILKKIKRKQDNVKIFEVWTSIFMIDEKEYSKISFEISDHLRNLHGEVEIIRSYMLSTDFEELLYGNYLNSINNILAVDIS